MKVTAEEISKKFNVSRTTVYRALHDKADINPETKEKIVKFAKKMGYTPNQVAVSLAKSNTMSIGVVVYDLDNYFFAQLLSAIEKESRRMDYFVYLMTSGHSPKEERACIEHMLSRQVMGLILYSSNTDKDFLNYLHTLNIPVVIICNKICDDITFVGIDDKKASKELFDFVKQYNYKRYLYVVPNDPGGSVVNVPAILDRVEGFRCAYREQLQEECPVLGLNEFTEMFDLLSIPKDGSTAILAGNDFCALKILALLRKKGYEVPEDVGLAGFDDIDFLECVTPGITTVKYPINEVGSFTVDLLIKKIEGAKVPVWNIMSYEIMNRDSLHKEETP